MSDIKTYPTMNAEIKNILRIGPVEESPHDHYAAARIEELEQQVAELTNQNKGLAIDAELSWNRMTTAEDQRDQWEAEYSIQKDKVAELTARANKNYEAWRADFEALQIRADKAEGRVKVIEGALESIAKNTCCDSCREAALVAQKALAGEKKI